MTTHDCKRLTLSAVCFAAMFAVATASAAGTFFKKKRGGTPTQVAVAAPAPTPAPPPTPPTPEPEQPAPPSVPVAAAEPIAGVVDQVVSLDTLSIGGRHVRLSGVRAEGGDTSGLARWLASNGNQVSCEPVGERYRCRNPRGADVAQIILFNGAARTDADASQEYREVEAQARAAGKGLWAAR